MIRILSFLFCYVLLSTNMLAKVSHRLDNPEYVGINNKMMKLISVKTTKKSTTITFRYPGEGFGGFSTESYLSDEAGRRYRLIGHKGFSVADSSYLKVGRKGTYRLEFEPLPAGTKVFDFIENFFYPHATFFYGIREAGTPMLVSQVVESTEEFSFPDIDFKPDSVWIHGYITDYDTARYQFTDVEQFLLGGELTGNDSPIVRVEPDGSFVLPLKIYGPTWTHLNLHSNKHFIDYLVPVMLYPGDHIELRISDIDKAEWNIWYTSRMGKEYSNLMHCIPPMCLKMIVGGNLQEVKQDSIRYGGWTPELIDQQFDSYDTLASYLTGKYALNNVEAAMLRGELTNSLARDVLIATNNYLASKHPIHKDREEWIKQESPYYSCLSRVYAESNAYLAIPSWQHLQASFIRNAMPRLSYVKEQYWQSMGNRFYDLPIAKTKEEMDEQLYQVIRAYRQPKGDDVIFEQAVRFNLLGDAPYWIYDTGKVTETMTMIHELYNYQRSQLTHPSFVRIANDVITTFEEKHYQEVECHMRGHKE